MDKKVDFNWKPLLFLLIPIWSVVSGFIPAFQNLEYDIIATTSSGDPIGAGQVGLFQAYLYATDFVKIFFFTGLISACLIGIYGVFAAFFPLLRRFKIMYFSILALMILQGTGYVAGGFLLANYIERFSIDYFASQSRIFDEFNALAFMNLNLLLSMAIPALLFLWWVWSGFALRFRKGD